MDNAFEFDVAGGDFFGIGKLPKITNGVCLVPAQWRLEADASEVIAAITEPA